MSAGPPPMDGGNPSPAPQNDSAPSSGAREHFGRAREEASRAGQAPEREQPQSSVTDLETLEKFQFGGREFTPDQLRKAMMLHADYTKKAQALAQERKYTQNLSYDLEKIKANPALADQFREIYPKEFHSFLNYVLAGGDPQQAGAQANRGQEGSQGSANPSALNPEVQTKLERLENYIKSQEVEKHEARLEAKFSVLSKKYPDAIEDVVLARAQTLLDQGVTLSDAVWEKLWKKSHDDFQSKLSTKQKQALERQRDANRRANDTGSAGGTPGHAPAKLKLKDVSEHMIADIRQNGRSR